MAGVVAGQRDAALGGVLLGTGLIELGDGFSARHAAILGSCGAQKKPWSAIGGIAVAEAHCR
jgi:hypothetical protein